MEKGNQTKSAFENTSNLFYRENGKLSLRKFLENFNGNGNSNVENKQITQCVFLGALCLKPVPDIFQVALQPYTFKTRTKTVLHNNGEGLIRNTRKQSRKNTRRTTNCTPINNYSRGILELFSDPQISQTLSKLGLNSQTSGEFSKSPLENVVPIEKNVKNSRNMDVKSKQLPLLLPANEIIDLDTKNGDVQKVDPLLMELDEDDIEDYLEVDQNVVADLEALIPDEEIEFISNSLIKTQNSADTDIAVVSSDCDLSKTVNNLTKIEEINEIPVIKQDEIEKIPEINNDNEPKVNEVLETIAINECDNVNEISNTKPQEKLSRNNTKSKFEPIKITSEASTTTVKPKKEASVISTDKPNKIATEASVINTEKPRKIASEASVINTKKPRKIASEASAINPEKPRKITSETSAINPENPRKIASEASVTTTENSCKIASEASVINIENPRKIASEASAITEKPREIEVKQSHKNLTIIIPDDKKDNEARTLRSGVKVSPPNSQNVKNKKSQIPKLIPVKTKKTEEITAIETLINNGEKVQNNVMTIDNTINNVKDIQEEIIPEKQILEEDSNNSKNEEIGPKLPIPTIVIDDNVKEEAPNEAPIKNTELENSEITENHPKNNEIEKNLNIFEKMMKNREKQVSPKTKKTGEKQQKARLNPKKRNKTAEIQNAKNKLTENSQKINESVRKKSVENVAKPVVKNKSKVEKIMNKEQENISKKPDKVEAEVKKHKKKGAVQKTNIRENKRKMLKKNQPKERIKTKTTETNPDDTNLNNIDIKTLESIEIPDENQNNNDTISTTKKDKQTKRTQNNETSELSRKKPKKEAEMPMFPPGYSELSWENKDPEMQTEEQDSMTEAQMDFEYQMEYQMKAPYRRIYKCRVCLIIFETYNKLKIHKMVHDVKNPYQCQECGESYDDVEELAAHLRIHKAPSADENEETIIINKVPTEPDEDEEFDVKISTFPKVNKTNSKNSVKQNLRSHRNNKKGKVLEKQKKAETIQMKIEEIKKKLNNVIKKEVDSEQMGIRQKFTRSSFRKVDVKSEPPEEEETPEETELPEQEFEELTNVKLMEETPVEYEEIDEPYEETEDPIDVGETAKERDLYEFDEEEENPNAERSIENYDDEDENVEIEDLTGVDIEEYIPGQEITTQRRRGRKRKGTKKNEVKIIKVKRGNLPPLILKTVRKKTLLLGKMPYPCKKCDSSFWTSVQLERHQMVHVLKKVPPPNNTTPKRIFKCEECGKEFKKICDLERHTRVHTGEKPSVCNICNKRFQQAYNLNKHLLIHTQEKNFECIICQKKFGRNDVLNRHVLTHSIDKPFHCSICSKTFIRNTQLNLHLKKHHGLDADPKADESGAGKSSD